MGEALACGGDALMRRAALDQVGGYNPTLIAGEEPELCVRLRAKGWQIWRLDAEMTLHDVNMTRFSQWWHRTRRGGHAAAEGVALHGRGPDRLGVAMVRRALIWGLVLPVADLCWRFSSAHRHWFCCWPIRPKSSAWPAVRRHARRLGTGHFPDAGQIRRSGGRAGILGPATDASTGRDH